MFFLKGTNPRVTVKHYSLQPNLERFLATVDVQFGAYSMPADGSLFLLDENEKIVQIRSQKDYERNWNLLKPASGHTPFLMYARLHNIDKVEATLKRGPQNRDGGAATETAAGNESEHKNLVLTASENYDRTFRSFEKLIMKEQN